MTRMCLFQSSTKLELGENPRPSQRAMQTSLQKAWARQQGTKKTFISVLGFVVCIMSYVFLLVRGVICFSSLSGFFLKCFVQFISFLSNLSTSLYNRFVVMYNLSIILPTHLTIREILLQCSIKYSRNQLQLQQAITVTTFISNDKIANKKNKRRKIWKV